MIAVMWPLQEAVEPESRQEDVRVSGGSSVAACVNNIQDSGSVTIFSQKYEKQCW
jgi:hypothetical protein